MREESHFSPDPLFQLTLTERPFLEPILFREQTQAQEWVAMFICLEQQKRARVQMHLQV